MKLYNIQFNYFDIDLPLEALENCYHAGACDQDVAYYIPICLQYLEKIDPDSIRKELSEYGAWNAEELQDMQDNYDRILWIASGNYHDEH